MSPRGGDHGGRKPTLESKGMKPRQPLNCRVDAESNEWIKQTSESKSISTGQLIDAAIKALRSNPEHLDKIIEPEAQGTTH